MSDRCPLGYLFQVSKICLEGLTFRLIETVRYMIVSSANSLMLLCILSGMSLIEIKK